LEDWPLWLVTSEIVDFLIIRLALVAGHGDETFDVALNFFKNL